MSGQFGGFYEFLSLHQKVVEEGQDALKSAKSLFSAPVLRSKEELVFRISNPQMKGKTLLIGQAAFVFNTEGVVQMPERFAKECSLLLKRPGFSLLEDKTPASVLKTMVRGEYPRKDFGEKIKEKEVVDEVEKFFRKGQSEIAKIKAEKRKEKRYTKAPVEREKVDLDAMVEDVSPKYETEEAKAGIEEKPPTKKKRGRPPKKR